MVSNQFKERFDEQDGCAEAVEQTHSHENVLFLLTAAEYHTVVKEIVIGRNICKQQHQEDESRGSSCLAVL